MDKIFNQIYVEISNICNLNFPFCIHSKRKQNVMSNEEFKIVMNEIAPYTKSVYLHVLGEPLIHPNFLQILETAKEKKINLKITTNGINLSKYGDEIIKSGIVKRVNISLQAMMSLKEVEYEKYLSNVLTFVKKASTIGSLNVSLRVWGNFKKESSAVKEVISRFFLKNLGINEIENGKMVLPHVYFSLEEEFKWPSLTDEINNNRTTCLGGKTHLGILSDGRVVICCLDSNGETALGNIFSEPFSKIIKNPQYQSALEGFKTKKAILPLCKKCTYRNRFIKKNEEVLK